MYTDRLSVMVIQGSNVNINSITKYYDIDQVVLLIRAKRVIQMAEELLKKCMEIRVLHPII